MTRLSTRTQRKPKASLNARQDNPNRAAHVFRDFVRQLEKLDVKPPKAARGAAR